VCGASPCFDTSKLLFVCTPIPFSGPPPFPTQHLTKAPFGRWAGCDLTPPPPVIFCFLLVLWFMSSLACADPLSFVLKYVVRFIYSKKEPMKVSSLSRGSHYSVQHTHTEYSLPLLVFRFSLAPPLESHHGEKRYRLGVALSFFFESVFFMSSRHALTAPQTQRAAATSFHSSLRLCKFFLCPHTPPVRLCPRNRPRSETRKCS